MKKVYIWLYICAAGNLLPVIGMLSSDTNSIDIYDAISGASRTMISVWLFITAHYLSRKLLRGWQFLSWFMWFLCGLLVFSPFWILSDNPPNDVLSTVMVFIGQWFGAGMMVWANIGWWNKEKYKFSATPTTPSEFAPAKTPEKKEDPPSL